VYVAKMPTKGHVDIEGFLVCNTYTGI